MGRKSRLKWEYRRNPPSPLPPPLETRWGTHPLARAWGGMLQGLGIGAFAAAAFGLIAAGRLLFLEDPPAGGEIRALAIRYVGGFLLGGIIAGALAPVRELIGGRRAQGIVFIGVAGLVWMPWMREITGNEAPGALWFAWTLMTGVFGLAFAKWFAMLDDRYAPSYDNLDPDHRSGRRHRIR